MVQTVAACTGLKEILEGGSQPGARRSLCCPGQATRDHLWTTTSIATLISRRSLNSRMSQCADHIYFHQMRLLFMSSELRFIYNLRSEPGFSVNTHLSSVLLLLRLLLLQILLLIKCLINRFEIMGISLSRKVFPLSL